MANKIAIIIGAGPAGLTAAYELLVKTDIQPIILESSGEIGGISKTVKYHGNHIDIGGHRFFSKSDKIMSWWLNILPLQGAPAKDDLLLRRPITDFNFSGGLDPEKEDRVMLTRNRLSRIFFLNKFFPYPVTLSFETLKNLGLIRVLKIGLSYIWIRIFPIKEEKSLEDFFINRFGRELYLTFFKDYTEKLWGVSCAQIKPEWGAQRVKGLSVTKTISHAFGQLFKKNVDRQKVETSLIDSFYYPKYGPGQMWESVAKIIQDRGGEIHLHHEVVGLDSQDGLISQVRAKDNQTGEIKEFRGDYFFSTMPIKDLVDALEVEKVPPEIKEISQGLQYRDFVTVGLLVKKMKIKNKTKIRTLSDLIPDTWIYIQEKGVKLGRLQVFNNWSPYLVNDLNNVWLGLEYFCNEGDELWLKTEKDMANLAINELVKIGVIDRDDVLDSVVIKMKKAYPAYFGTYDRLDEVKDFLNGFANLFLIGRNGQHRYNNMDHSMLTAMAAVENIISNIKSKENIWSVNTEEQYHEEKN